MLKLLRAGLIEPRESPWSSPTLLVPKPNGQLRVALDYRQVNKLTVRSAYCLPRIDEILATMGGAQYYSSLDGKSAFHTLELDQESQDVTSFCTHGMGQFVFTRMPMGLASAASGWQKVVDHVCSDLLWVSVLAYLDDFVIYSADFESHLRDLEVFLARMKQHNITLSLKKTRLAAESLPFLGHIVGRSGISADPAKVAALGPLLDTAPTSVHQVRTFLGCASYFRAFIPHYATIVEPLTPDEKCVQT